MSTATTVPSSQREPELLGQTVVVIGGSGGIGLEMPRVLKAKLNVSRPEPLSSGLYGVSAMILGMTLATFTLLHVVLSLAGIGSGFVVLFGLLNRKRLDGWTAIFLCTTVATSVTGFLFPFHELLPSHVVGAISLLVLAVAIVARYVFHLAGAWRRGYVISALVALYLNVFVAVVQAFLKIPALKALAPTQKELPFVVAQLTVLLLFVALTILAARRFRIEPAHA